MEKKTLVLHIRITHTEKKVLEYLSAAYGASISATVMQIVGAHYMTREFEALLSGHFISNTRKNKNNHMNHEKKRRD